MPTPSMTTRGSGLMATGLALAMISVSAGVSSGDSLVLLLSFAGVLAGASFIFFGVRMADDDPPAPMGRPGVLAAGPWILDASVPVRALVHYLLRNLGLAGLLLASVAATATADREETGPVLCFSAFVLLLVGLSLLNIGVLLGEQEQEH